MATMGESGSLLAMANKRHMQNSSALMYGGKPRPGGSRAPAPVGTAGALFEQAPLGCTVARADRLGRAAFHRRKYGEFRRFDK
jgi:hypothetical protein